MELNMKKGYRTGEKSFPCEVCGRSFKRRSQLDHHSRLYTGEKSFSCTICDKAFAHECSLFDHKRIHTGEKVATCNFCGKSFNKKSYLVVHMRRHAGEKPFPCTVCDKAFVSKSDLTGHMRFHTLGKPFACRICAICGRSFSKNNYYSTHMRRHAEEKPFPDGETSQGFANATRWNMNKDTNTIELNDEYNSKDNYLKDATNEWRIFCGVCDKRLSGSDMVTLTQLNLGNTIHMLCCQWVTFLEGKSEAGLNCFMNCKGFNSHGVFVFCQGCASGLLSCSLCGAWVTLCNLRLHLGLHTGEVKLPKLRDSVPQRGRSGSAIKYPFYLPF